MLLEFLGQRIQFVSTCENWEHAIEVAAAPLLEEGFITAGYVEAMKTTCRDYNAYIVLADLFAMPHASPESGVLNMGAAITICREPIDFLGKPVQVLLALAPIDNHSHLQLLKDVAAILGEEENIRRLIDTVDKDEVLSICRQYLK